MESSDGIQGSLSVTTSSNDRSFTTSGQINWDALLRSAVNVSVGVLSCVSAAGVDAYTVVVGQKLGSQFQLTSPGRQRITSSIVNLRCFGGIGQALWFGFGIKHLVRVLARTEEGKLCILLCASLAECYETSIAAEVLIEMAKSSRAPEELLPSILEWNALIDVCAGILASTEFPRLAETYMSLYPLTRDFPFLTTSFNPKQVKGCSSPESLAKVLLAIGRISRGDLEAITIVGGPDAGWVAAFAEWFFQISIRIIDGSTQRVLFESPNFTSHTSITVIYEDRPDESPGPIQLTTHMYSLQDATSLIIRERRDGRAAAACVSGRVSWTNAFTRMFSSEFKTLLNNPVVFGSMIGCAARILRAVATREKGIKASFPPGGEYFEESSYGRGFVDGLCDRFTELRALQDHIAGEHDLKMAMARYDANITILRLLCGCSFCRHDYEGIQEQYCLIYIIETIIVIGQLLSVIDLPIAMEPSRLGCLELYRRQMQTHRELQESEDGSEDAYKILGNAAFIFRRPSAHLLFDALELFGGRQNRSYGLNTTAGGRHCAASRNGLCAYWQTLDPSTEGALRGRICVVPGKIEFRGKASKDLLEPASRPSLDDARNLSYWQSAMHKSLIKLKETTDGLILHFEIPKISLSTSDVANEPLTVRPASSVEGFLQAKGQVECSRSGCGSIDSLGVSFVVQREEGRYVQYSERDLDLEVFFLNNLGLQKWVIADSSLVKFFVTDECEACCLKAALSALQSSLGARRAYVIRNDF